MRVSHLPSRITTVVLYGVLLLALMLEKAGDTTSDTKASLITAPGALLRSTFSLWNPQVSLGELQNQAYGYLFPMGPFFAGLQALGSPPWVTERLWSWVVVVVACEGVRLVSRELGLRPWPALAAGLAYGLNVRMISEIGVRSAEVLPTAVIPWVLLPVLWVLRGRIGPRSGALCSAAAFLFVGAVNGTATIAPLPLVLVFVIWGCRRGLVGWSFLGWWSGFIALASLWWASSLVQLSAYSPPFFDYVEDARTTTSTTGFDPSVRGASNWVGYLRTGGEPAWPSAWSLDYHPALVAATGVLAAVSLVGLAVFRSRWRPPLLLSAVLGLACLTIAHTSQSWVQSPLAPGLQAALDHPFALLRNVAKVDAVFRLPLAVGFGVALTRGVLLVRVLAARPAPWRARAAGLGVACACLAVVAGGQPLLAMNVRTPGWSSMPSYWTQTASFLHAQPGQNAAWVVPGTGFGIQTWGWTMDEPMSIVGRSPWVTRSQVPLVNAETIRMLGSMEDVLDTGSGSAQLGQMLDRLGVGFVVLRHDLDRDLADSSPSSLVSVALARSSGIHRVATFGALAFGPAIEVFEVDGRNQSRRADLRVTPLATVRTVSSGPADVLTAVGAGLITTGESAVVAGDSGWSQPAEIVGDGYQLRERQFGRVHAAEGVVLAPGDQRRSDRLVANYPGSPGARPVVADYHGIRTVNASTAQSYPDSLGAIRPESSPYAAIDGDPTTAWTTSYLTRPLGQWLTVDYGAMRSFGTVRIHGDVGTSGAGVLRWRVTAGRRSAVARPDPFTGIATTDLRGARASTLRISVDEVGNGDRRGQISVHEIDASGLPVERSLVVPPTRTVPPTAYLFTSRPETRACVPTLLAPDCDPNRYRTPEEATGIDREVRLPEGGTWNLSGVVVARSDPSTVWLLDPFGGDVMMRASSTYLDDPTVSARMAYDATPNTSWIADPRDPSPTLTVDFRRPRRIDRLSVAAPPPLAVAPTTARLVSGAATRTVDLNGFGTFKPLVTRHVEISFQNPVRGGKPIGVGDVRLGPGDVTEPIDTSASTGAICGYGPNVFVDGVRFLTKVDGRMGDVSSPGPLSLIPCQGPIPLGAGEHRIRIASTPQFQPVRVVLAEDGAGGDPTRDAAVPTRTLQILAQSATSQRARLGGGAGAFLVTGRNWNNGWRATLDGRVLVPQRIDGWAQGWRLPPGSGGTVEVRYQPQSAYRIGLVGGLAIAGLILVLALVVLLRKGVGVPSAPPPQSARRRHVLPPGILTSGAVVAAGYVLGGLPGLAGAVIARTGAHQGRRLALAGVLVVAGSLVTATAFLLNGPGLIPQAADLLTGTGAVLALVLGLTHARDDQD